jgi:hypothetical protein
MIRFIGTVIKSAALRKEMRTNEVNNLFRFNFDINTMVRDIISRFDAISYKNEIEVEVIK